MSDKINDNNSDYACAGEPDAHGQAALLLAESILHSLIERDVLTSPQAAAVVESAAEVKVEVAMLAGESRKRMEESLALLSKISISLRTDAQ